MPIGPYDTWDECIAANRDKADPEAYCGALERDSKMAGMATHVALLVPEGVQTSDRRFISEGALTWRDPAPLMFTDQTTDGHAGAVFVGNLTGFRPVTVDGVRWIAADVEWDTDDTASEARRLVDEGRLSGISADIGDVTSDVEVLDVDEYGDAVDWREVILAGEIIGGTQVAMPAFGDARIYTSADFTRLQFGALAASAAPRSWFADPELERLTPLTVTDDGRIFGHLAPWGECHIGHETACVTAPRSDSGYRWFHTGAVVVDGETIPVGQITMGIGHAPLNLSAKATADHYDNTDAVVADVVCGEDQFGIWVAGAVRPGVSAERVEALRASSLSGDWRSIGGTLELVAALAVNVPGFPIARVASGEQLALVAGGVRQASESDQWREIAARLADEIIILRAEVDEMRRPARVRTLRSRLEAVT
jgi:hypothetical protein